MAGSLTDFQRAVSNLENQTGIRGQAIYSSPQYAQLVQSWFGDIPVPPGAEVVSKSPFSVTYKDAFGNQRTATRNMDARFGDFGSVNSNISQPSAQGPYNELDFYKSQEKGLQDLFSKYLGQQTAGRSDLIDRVLGISNRLEQTPTLGTPDPSVMALLSQIKANDQAQLAQQFQNQNAALTADLFGSGINRSSIAADQAGRLMGQQGLVQAQSLSDAAQRELAIRQFLSQMEQQNLALSGQNLLQGAGIENQQQQTLQSAQFNVADYLQKLLNQGLSRELGLGQLGIAERGQSLAERQALNQNQFNLAQLDLQQKQARGSLLNKILGGVGSLASAFIGIPGLSNLAGGLFKGGGGGTGIAGYPMSDVTGG